MHVHLGEVGTPPNCTCPSGTEFMGYKGCLKSRPSWYCFSRTDPGSTHADVVKGSTKGEAQAVANHCRSLFSGNLCLGNGTDFAVSLEVSCLYF
jgi:hypothetical protein